LAQDDAMPKFVFVLCCFACLAESTRARTKFAGLKNSKDASHSLVPVLFAILHKRGSMPLARTQLHVDMIGHGLHRSTSNDRAVAKLKHDFGISGKELATFMSESVAARLDDEKFWSGLQRLQNEFGISGKDLVAFMSDSVAARLGNQEFVNALEYLCQQVEPTDAASIMTPAFAPRLNSEFAKSIIRMICHINTLGLAGVTEVKRLISNRPLCGKIPELEAEIMCKKTQKELQDFLNEFKGSDRHKSQMARRFFG